MRDKIVLIDGHSILNRAFYGLPDLTNSKGMHTNAVYGFLNILFKILEEEKPQYLTVAFDVSAPTFRHKMYDAYKGTRKPMAEELRSQVPMIQELLQAMGVIVVKKEGLEADDILGTISRIAQNNGLDVSIVSGDRDLLQLATEHVKIRIPKTKKTGTEIEDYLAEDVKERYHVTPTEFIDVKALMGDSSDNIPGVPGVGEKTATTLIEEYHSIENLYEHIEEVRQKRAKEKLEENKELAFLSKTLATIALDCDIDYALEDAKVKDFYTKEAYVLCREWEFKNLLGKFPSNVSEETVEKEQVVVFETVEALDEVANLFKALLKEKRVAFTLLEEDEVIGLCIANDNQKASWIPVQGFVTADYLVDQMRGLIEAGDETVFLTFELKNQLKRLYPDGLPIRLRDRIEDLALMDYLLRPLKGDYPYEDIASEYAGWMVQTKKELLDKSTIKHALEDSTLQEKVMLWIGNQVVCAMRCYEQMKHQLIEEQLDALYQNIERPLIGVLADMEMTGIYADAESLVTYGQGLETRIHELEASIYEAAGENFNINSPKQLGVILFEKLGLPFGKKTKTGYSTAADVLEKLAADYPLVADILEYRQLAKLKSTYADGLGAYIEADGRIHTNFQQMITATGRLSSTEPNLQNIPIRMELGRMIRKVFLPKEGFVFMDADYSQIELRVLAHMSGDERLIAAYQQAEDIHRITASEVFHIPFDEVTDLQRRNAKAVNFGIVYGISSFGLSQDLSITKKEAAEYIEKYFETYPGIKGFLDDVVNQAKESGVVTTMFGRKRPVPELASSNFMQRSFGERIAMNSPIQGTAADIIKIAMIRVHDALEENGLRSRLILQVHDELLIEAALDEQEIVASILEKEMKQAAQLAVELEIDMHTGNNWYEAK